MIVKLLGAAALIVCSTAAGIALGQRLKARQRALARYSGLLSALADGISRGRPLPTLIDPADGLVEFSGLGFAILNEDISSADKVVLEEFFSGLGLSDTDSQIKRCRLYLELIKKQEASAAEQVSTRAPLYGRLGFFAGLFITVLVI